MASRSETDKIHEKICEVTAEYFLTNKRPAIKSQYPKSKIQDKF
mgnify:CR=1 FL=1